MAHKQKRPPINIELSNEDFNILVETIIKENNDYFKRKLLRYSVIDDEHKIVSFWLFQREVKELTLLIIKKLKEKEINLDYFNIVKEIQKKVMEVNSDNE